MVYYAKKENNNFEKSLKKRMLNKGDTELVFHLIHRRSYYQPLQIVICLTAK